MNMTWLTPNWNGGNLPKLHNVPWGPLRNRLMAFSVSTRTDTLLKHKHQYVNGASEGRNRLSSRSNVIYHIAIYSFGFLSSSKVIYRALEYVPLITRDLTLSQKAHQQNYKLITNLGFGPLIFTSRALSPSINFPPLIMSASVMEHVPGTGAVWDVDDVDLPVAGGVHEAGHGLRLRLRLHEGLLLREGLQRRVFVLQDAVSGAQPGACGGKWPFLNCGAVFFFLPSQ